MDHATATHRAKNAGISLFEHEIASLRERASRMDGGSPSRYVRRLLLEDIRRDDERSAVLSKLTPAERELIGVNGAVKGVAA